MTPTAEELRLMRVVVELEKENRELKERLRAMDPETGKVTRVQVVKFEHDKRKHQEMRRRQLEQELADAGDRRDWEACEEIEERLGMMGGGR